MARGQGRGGQTRGRGKPVRDYYEGLPSDSEYKSTAHQRAVQQTRKTWLTRLLVVAALAGAWHLWGGDVVRAVTVRAHQTESELQGAGGTIKEGRDRRSGADWVEK